MLITKKIVADKIAAYLHHDITHAQLVDWAERAMTAQGRFRKLTSGRCRSDQVSTTTVDFRYRFGAAHASALEMPGGGVKSI